MKYATPKNIKRVVNAFIILGGAGAAIIGMTPDSMLAPEHKLFILNAGGIMAGALKALEKLFVEQTPRT